MTSGDQPHDDDDEATTRFWSRYREAGSRSAGSEQGDPEAGEPGADHRGGDRCLDWCPICRGAERLEEAIPPELADQLRLVQRDALLLARAAIDTHLARFEDRAGRPEDRSGRDDPEPPPSEEDIPIE